MAKGFKINGVDFDDLFHAPVSGIDTVTFAGLSPTCTYCKRITGSNPNAAGYWKYNGVVYDAQPKNVEPWTAQTITLTNPNSSLVFRSISGNLYTNSSCTTKATTNRKYTWSTYYYKSNETRPSGSYLYDYGDGKAGSATTSEEPPQDTITSYYNEGSLTACLGTSGYCWSGTMYYIGFFYRINLSNGSWDIASPSKSYHRVRETTF